MRYLSFSYKIQFKMLFFYRMHARLWFSISVLWYKDERDFVTSFSTLTPPLKRSLSDMYTKAGLWKTFLQHFKYQLRYRSQLSDITNISYKYQTLWEIIQIHSNLKLFVFSLILNVENYYRFLFLWIRLNTPEIEGRHCIGIEGWVLFK